MKVSANEYNGCFSIDLEAETMAEAALLVRMGMNALDGRPKTWAFESATSTTIVFRKHKRSSSEIPKRAPRG